MLTHNILASCESISGPNSEEIVFVPKDLFDKIVYFLAGTIDVDEVYYLSRYPDVESAIKNGIFENAKEHFRSSGFLEKRLPKRIQVDEIFYLTSNPDVRDAVRSGVYRDAQEHYEYEGYAEGRLPYVGFSLFI